MKNKFMSLVLTLCLVVAACLTVFAEDVTTFTGTAARTDDTITVTLTVDQPGATSGQVSLSYDEEALTLVSASFGSALDTAIADDDHADSINTAEAGLVTAGFASLTASEAGDVLIVVFTVENETAEGEYSFPYCVDEWSSAQANDLLTDAAGSTGTIVLTAEGESNVVDKTELQASYDEGSALEESDYTEDSWAAFEDAMTEAAAVLADENATQEEVDEANAALQAAIAALVKADASEETTTAASEDETTASDGETTVSDSETTASDGETTVSDSETTASDGETTVSDDETTAASENAEETTTAVSGSTGGTTGTGDRNLTVLWVTAIAALAAAVILVAAGRKQRA